MHTLNTSTTAKREWARCCQLHAGPCNKQIANLQVFVAIVSSCIRSPAGITLSQSQVRRGTELAAEQGLDKCSFQVMNALHMDYPDNSFDLVWACESGEHMPDKKAYVEEMTRVLKPGMPALCDSKVLCMLLTYPFQSGLLPAKDQLDVCC